jgi:hypothetical protein
MLTQLPPNSKRWGNISNIEQRKDSQRDGQGIVHPSLRLMGRDVTVTLDICTALIKKCFRDLGLFASNIVAILVAVIKDGELVLVEHSVLTVISPENKVDID